MPARGRSTAGSSGPADSRLATVLGRGLRCGRARIAGVAALVLAATTAAVSAEPVVLDVAQAVTGVDERSGQVLVSFVLTASGRDAFARFTAANVGRRVVLRLDGEALTRPVIRETVMGGVGQIPANDIDQGRRIVARLTQDGARLEVEALD